MQENTFARRSLLIGRPMPPEPFPAPAWRRDLVSAMS
jgi:hypothetical protein